MPYQVIAYKWLAGKKKEVVKWNDKNGTVRIQRVSQDGVIEKETVLECKSSGCSETE